MAPFSFYVSLVAAVVAVAFVAADMDYSWGGVQVSADGSTIYAYQYKNGGSAYRSLDSGKSFHSLDYNAVSGWLGTGAIDANGTTIILGSTNAGGVLESLDGGDTWHDVESLPSYSDVHMYEAMAINDDATEMFAGVSNSGHLFRKKGQDEWKHLQIPGKIPFNSVSCNSIAISKDGSNVYVADDNMASEILASSDHGDTWSNIRVTNDAELYPLSVAFAKEDPSTMVVGMTDFGLSSGALFVSTDGGQTFSDLTAQTQAMPFARISISCDGRYILAGSVNLWGTDKLPWEQQGHLFLSNDRGATWNTIEFPRSLPVGFQRLSMSRDGKIMAAIGEDFSVTKMYISNDYGQTWADTNDRIHHDY